MNARSQIFRTLGPHLPDDAAGSLGAELSGDDSGVEIAEESFAIDDDDSLWILGALAR